MPHQRFAAPLAALALVLALAAPVFPDTIHLRDGTVIRGQIIAFKDQQFTVLIGTGTRGRRSRLTLNIEDVESVEFDSALSGANGTVMMRSNLTWSGRVQLPSRSIAKSHFPFSESHCFLSSWGRG